MHSDPQRPAWWRIPSPSILLLVLLLSFLPWIEIGCENKLDTKNLFGGQAGAANVSVSTTGGKTVLATQSGFQIATGGHTERNPLGDLSKGGKKGVSIGTPSAQGQLDGSKNRPSAAPLLFFFFISLLAAVVVGLAMPPSRTRILVVAALTGAAVILLLIQSRVLGFPAVNDVAKKMNGTNAAQGVVGLNAGGFFVRYTVWYWLTWALLFGAFVPLVLEEVRTRKKRLAL
jgi:hypothetical protein